MDCLPPKIPPRAVAVLVRLNPIILSGRSVVTSPDPHLADRRTVIVVAGSIELLLDDGAATLVEAGGIVIQRGTIHSWRNPSADVTARMVFVLLDATSATVDGASLPDIHPGDIPKE